MMQKKSKLSTIGTRNLVKLFGHKRKDRKEKKKKTYIFLILGPNF